MSRVINIRGCNGSGKTYTVTGLLQPGFCPSRQQAWGMDVYTVKTPAWTATVLGKYETACGGMDTVKTQVMARHAVELSAARNLPDNNVVFEGVLISTIYGPWRDLTKRLEEDGHEVLWGFMDTPLEVCLERIYQRNGGKPIKEKLVADKHRTIANVRRKALADGIRVVDIDHRAPREELLEMLS